MATDALNISTGIGQGDAQVFDLYDPRNAERIAAANEDKRNKENKNIGQVYDELDKIKTSGIFYKHQPIFAEKQKELYDYAKSNIKALKSGDAKATIDFREKINKLGNDIAMSKGVADSYGDVAKEYIRNLYKYRPEVKDKLKDFQGYDIKTDQFENVDPSIMKQHTDLSKNFNETILPNLKQSIQEGQKAFNIGNKGQIRTDEFKKLPETIIRNKIDTWISDPVIHEQAYTNYKQNNPDKEPSLDDLKDDLYKKYGESYVKDEHKIGLTQGFNPKEGKDETNNYTITPIDKKVTLNDKTQEEDPTYTPVETNVKSWELKQNIPIQKEISEVYNPQTFEKETPVGSQKFSMSSIVEHVIDKKTGQPVMVYDQNVIDKHPELYEKKKFASGVMGTGKEAHPVYIPFDVVQPTLKERKINLNGVDELNKTPKTITSKSKSGKDIFSEDGGKTWQYK